jgi:hypothetical protein
MWWSILMFWLGACVGLVAGFLLAAAFRNDPEDAPVPLAAASVDLDPPRPRPTRSAPPPMPRPRG